MKNFNPDYNIKESNVTIYYYKFKLKFLTLKFYIFIDKIKNLKIPFFRKYGIKTIIKYEKLNNFINIEILKFILTYKIIYSLLIHTYFR